MKNRIETLKANRDSYMQLLGYYKAKKDAFQIREYECLIHECDRKIREYERKQ